MRLGSVLVCGLVAAGGAGPLRRTHSPPLRGGPLLPTSRRPSGGASVSRVLLRALPRPRCRRSGLGAFPAPPSSVRSGCSEVLGHSRGDKKAVRLVFCLLYASDD